MFVEVIILQLFLFIFVQLSIDTSQREPVPKAYRNGYNIFTARFNDVNHNLRNFNLFN